MKPNTIVHVALLNPGNPHDEQRFEGRVDDAIRKIMTWLLTVTMSDHIRIVVARNPEDLLVAIRRKQSVANQKDELANELDSMLAALNLNAEVESN